MNNLKEEINKVIPNDLKVKLKEMLVKFQESVVTTPQPAVAAPVVAEEAPAEMPMKELKTKDGIILQVETFEVGKPVKQVTEAGIVDVADGDYEIETGEIVTVVGGVISDIKVPEVAAPEVAPVEPNAEMQSLKAKVTELSEMVANLSSQVNEQHSTIGLTLSAVNSIIEQPAAEPIQRPTLSFRITKEKQLENLSKLKK